ncbi:acyl-CoA N-acyltransferase [Aulographum hederae CBS 113979]|uniref:Acyl-CoA N-acyltransferase n=1 Tax=Aulographum hederae CBS 113979 TaxID=1176131 RepID=A0A6G1HC44_9PEZI|nr:acyl-CoA N-acyltransferase [Aulographum hederae CBS 113979]
MPSKLGITTDDIVLSRAEEGDLASLADGYYTAFAFLFDREEPEELRPTPEVRIARFIQRIKPWLGMPNTRLVKATVKGHPERVIGHAGWLEPDFDRIFNLWRRDAVEEYGWAEQQNWTQEQVDEIWSSVNLESWQKMIVKNDRVRKRVMGDEKHWYLAPLWVLEEYQGIGIGSMLLRDITSIADAEDPPTAVYLEARDIARPVYVHHGFEAIPPGEGDDVAMVRRGPLTKEWKSRQLA